MLRENIQDFFAFKRVNKAGEGDDAPTTSEPFKDDQF
jgi:hypothetical protein